MPPPANKTWEKTRPPGREVIVSSRRSTTSFYGWKSAPLEKLVGTGCRFR